MLPLSRTGRMYTSFKCLIWGEDLASDPVGFVLSVALKRISHGSLVLDVQVWPRMRVQGWPRMADWVPMGWIVCDLHPTNDPLGINVGLKDWVHL